MKRFVVMVRGEHEEEAAREILAGIYGAVVNNGYTDVSVQADTIRELNEGEIKIPSFLQEPKRRAPERAALARRG